MKTIGVLALQGNVALHEQALRQHQFATRLIRQPPQLSEVDGLVLPGGETTALLKLMAPWDFHSAITSFAASGRPILGTCAGAILLASEVNPRQASLGLMDISIERNAYGRQLDSFVGYSDETQEQLVFIRAPKVTAVGNQVDVILRQAGDPVLLRQGHIMAATYHPEMSGYARVAEFFNRT